MGSDLPLLLKEQKGIDTMATTTMMNEKAPKITKAMRFKELLTYEEVKANPEMVKFVEHELELLEKKNSGDKKPSKGQVENAVLQKAIYEQMEENRAYSVAELNKEIPECAELSNQKVSAQLRVLKAEGKVTKEMVKGKPFYTKVI